ncbi:hypothetical protein Nepgr_021341 [Nepenthes gracilis]|uniref:Uncharacterized protein n=1 Tax=Nepenthes gracilis TaxID=150966 RepID=A0AAD3XX48_NEPGR|nr:hypothetical protein Nepgr_021341 [Nepenthes gracilis]
MVKLIVDSLGDFRGDHLVSHVEAKWGPSSPVQKFKIPLPEVLQGKKRKKGFIIVPHPSDAGPPSPRQKRVVLVKPSSTSSRPDYFSTGCFAGVGVASGIETKLALKAYEARLNARVSSGVVLAQPALAKLTPDPFIRVLGLQELSIGSPAVELPTERQESILEPPTVPEESARMEDTS